MKTGAEEHWRLRLIELIKHLDITQRGFSDATGIDASYVSRLLYPLGKKGRKNLGLTQMSAIRDCYKLPAGWFDLPLGNELPAPSGTVNLRKIEANEATDASNVLPVRNVIWPFKLVSYKRLNNLERLLGKKQHAEAMASIDEHLDVLVTKFEQKSNADKRRLTK